MGLRANPPLGYRATVALVKPVSESTEDDQFKYLDRYFGSPVAARLWAARTCKNHQNSSGSAVVMRRTWERADGHWILMDEDCVWSM